MSHSQPIDHSHEPDNPPDFIVELMSLEETEPVSLVEQEAPQTEWPEPPESWNIDAHGTEYRDDVDVTLGYDDAPDEPVPPDSPKETEV